MEVILFSEQSIVLAVAVEEPLVVSIMAGQEDLAAVLHVVDLAARQSKLPQVLEILEEILEEV
jgi:phosphoribosylformimino-5-aminoimidazole carboxamide ribonucleotide (ProFAR) isomerase